MSRRNAGLLLVLAGAAAAGTEGLRVISHQHDQASRIPRDELIEVFPRHLEVGEVWDTDEYRVSVPIRCVAAEGVEITDVHVKCDCTRVVSQLPQRLTAAGSWNLQLAIDLRRVPKRPAEHHDRSLFHVEFRPVLRTANGRMLERSFVLRGAVRPVFRAIPEVVRLDHRLVQGDQRTAAVQFSVELHPDLGCQGVLATCPSGEGTVEIVPPHTQNGEALRQRPFWSECC